MKPQRKRGQNPLLLTFGLVAVVCLMIAFLNWGKLSEHATYVLESASEVQFMKNGGKLIIDNGKKTVLVIDAKNRLKRRYDGGSASAPFFYACYAVEGGDGGIWIADITYGDRGNLLDSERIIRLNGSSAEIMYDVDYTGWDVTETPLQYGRILELQPSEEGVCFLLDIGHAIVLYDLNAQGILSVKSRIPLTGVKNDAAYDISTGKIVVVTRDGEMFIYDEAGNASQVAVPAGLMPYDVAARSGEVYYTELKQKTVRHFSLSDPANDTVFREFEELPFKLDVSPDGRDVLVTDQIGCYVLTGGEAFSCTSADYISEAGNSYFIFVILTWASLIIGGLSAAILILRLVLLVGRSALKAENTLRVALIIAVAMGVSFVLAFTLLNQFMETNTTSSEKQVTLFTELLEAEISKNTDALIELDSPADRSGKAFESLKAVLDAHTWKSYERQDYFYYILYRIVDGDVVMVMDFEDTMPCGRPMYVDDPEDNDYSAVMHTGEKILTSEISAYGAWTFQLTPIVGSDGGIVGELEVGRSLDSLQRKRDELRVDLLFNSATVTIVIAMLLLEVSFLIAFNQHKRETWDLDTTERIPVRTLMFMSYLADSMQDAFIAILCTQLYAGGLPLPTGVAVALPMSAQLLMMALFSLFAGRLAERLGPRTTLTGGMLIQMSGFLVCLLLGNYWGLLIGKMLIGAGMGTVYVSCNTVAATGADESKVGAAFAGVSAGTISGLTIGAGLASVLLSMGGWKLIYLIGAIILALGALLALSSGDVRIEKRQESGTEKHAIGFFRFFLNARVLGFFVLTLVPFMMALSYREYFFPLFASERGIGEVRIGQMYLVCGMIVIYIGPVLSRWLLSRLGGLWSAVTASALMAANMLLFVLFPSLGSVIAGVVILSVIISFAYTCQYTYFEMTPETSAYGEGRAMGVYSVFESLGQTIGPIAYGALLSFGYRVGIGDFCAIMFILLAVFVVLMLRHRKIYSIKKE